MLPFLFYSYRKQRLGGSGSRWLAQGPRTKKPQDLLTSSPSPVQKKLHIFTDNLFWIWNNPPPLLDVINSYCCVFVCLFVFTWKITHNHLIMGYSVCWIFFLINGENRMITTDTWRPWKKCLCTLSRFLLENIIFMQCSQIKAARHWRFIACMHALCYPFTWLHLT